MNDPFNLARAQLLARVAGPEVAANVLKLAYVIAYKHMNVESKTAVVGHKTLAADLNVTVRTIQGLLITLKTFGVAINRGAGRNKLSVYRIASVAVESEDAKTVSSLEVEKASPTAFVDAETAKPNSLFPEPNPPARTRRQVADGFAAFWQAYPRRVAKGAAEKVYQRIIRNREATEAELLAGAMRYAAQRDGEEPQFTKHPATWLNGKCWTDEPPLKGGRPRGYLESIAAGLALVPDDEAAS